ncbi:ribosomal protein S5 domain 2-type protein [Aspergillus californicus]
MAPTSVLHAMQSVRSTTSLRAFLSRRSAPATYLIAGIPLPTCTQKQKGARGFATEYQPQQISQHAAEEINFDRFLAKPARIVPVSPSYFSGTPNFIDNLLRLELLLAKHAALPTVSGSDAPRMAWFKLPQFREFVGEAVPTKKYKGLLNILQRLNRIDRHIMPKEVSRALKDFTREGNPLAAKPVPATVDDLGRARGKGKRKASSAVVHLVEGDGEVLINGKTLVEAFPRVHDRESATWALRSTSRLDKYNVWAAVRGGGTTGQAEAMTLALGRALLIQEPALKSVLRKAGVITVDARRVERKKPGHIKARKAPTWVKR